MTFISELGPSARVQRPPPRARPGSSFSVAAQARTEAPAGVLAISMPSLLALQEEDAEAVADREARRHGQAMLSALAALQRGLLGGADGGALEQAAALARAAPAAADPRLAAVQRAILVRVAVEAARAKATNTGAAVPGG